jgi:formylglycine-generating enzyme required for sulfatase activity
MFCNYCGTNNPDDGLFCSRCGRSVTSNPSSPGSRDPVASALTEMSLPLNTVLLSRYRIIKELGAGGMGRVYLAQDEKLEIPVAIKVLRDILSRDPGSVRRLIAEAKHSMLLAHSNIVRVHNFEDGEIVKFLIMEYVEGETLAHRLAREGKLTEQETRRIGIEICKGLEHAHEKKLVHRDLKPGNILLGKDGSIKIADFGIARLCRDSVSRLTSQQDSGTLLYMSPEQLDGESGTSSDLYSLGVVLYEMLTGDPPFHTGEITAQIRNKSPRELQEFSPDMNRIVMRCLEKRPANRFASVMELQEELEEKGARRQQEMETEWRLKEIKALGTKAFDERKFVEAISFWEQALSLRPGDASLKEAIALAQRRQADLDNEEAAKRRADEDAARRRAEVEAAKRRAEEEAAKRRTEEEATRQKKLESIRTRAQAAYNARRFGEAVNLWKEALALNPGDASLQGAIAAVEHQLEAERREAERKATAEARKKWVGEALATAEALMNQGKYPEADSYLTQALLYDPDNETFAQWLEACRERQRQAPDRRKQEPFPAAQPKSSSGKKVMIGIMLVTLLVVAVIVFWPHPVPVPPKSVLSSGSSKPDSSPGSGQSTPVVTKPGIEEGGSKGAESGIELLGVKPDAEVPKVNPQAEAQRKAATDRIAKSFDEFFGSNDPPQNPLPGAIWRSPDGRDMAWIPGGNFQMGSPLTEFGRNPDEIMYSMTLARGYWMDTTEVTNSAYQQFLLANPQWQKGRISGGYHDGNYLSDWYGNNYPSGRGGYPVLFVSWYAARAYAAWAQKRLPSEAEWEHACRAGTTTAYWWGPVFSPDRANDANGTFPVGNAWHRNPWGLYDMSGNVAEWTSSLYMNYPYVSNDGRENPQPPQPRVIRGGSYGASLLQLRSASRVWGPPTTCGNSLGFRCAR